MSRFVHFNITFVTVLFKRDYGKMFHNSIYKKSLFVVRMNFVLFVQLYTCLVFHEVLVCTEPKTKFRFQHLVVKKRTFESLKSA